MRIGPDVIQSISENQVDISSGWAFIDFPVYSPRYTEIISNPISLEATTLDYFRFKVDTVNIQIRKGTANDSELIWSGISYNIQDEAKESEEPTNSTVQQVSTGVVGDMAPAAVYGQGTISIESAHVNLRDNPGHVGSIVTYLLTSASFTLTDGTEQYVVADYNNGNPIYRLENNKTNINSSNIVLIRICWRTGNVVHSVDYDSAGSGLANKIEASIIQTTPYRKSLDGGLTLSETSSPIERTVIVTPAIVFAGTTPQNLLAFNSSTHKLTFASVANGVWSYTSGTTQYDNTQYNPTTGLTTLGNNNYGVVWLYRSVGNDVEVFYVLGDSEYPTIAKAQTSKLRSDISLLLRDHCVLIGRIIIQKGATAGVVENVADVSFASSSITNHNDLNNIQGGSVGEYYHLSATQYNQLTSGGDTSLHNHSFDRNRSNHTGTQLASTISDFTSASRMLLSATTPIVYTSATGVFSHSTIGTAGTYTKVVTNATGHVTSGSVLTSADIPNLDASKITTGMFDIARIPALPADNVIITTAFSALTFGQQAGIVAGTTVLLSTDGRSFKYSGTGDKTLEGSYIYISDQTPDWSIIANRPTAVSYWSNDAGYLTNTTGDARYSLTGHLHTGQYLPLSGGTLSVDGDNGIRFFDSTRIYKAVGGGLIFRSNSGNIRPKFEDSTGTNWTIWDAGNLTNLNQLTNGPGYLTNASSLSWSKVTGTPTTISGYGITDALVYRTNNSNGVSRLYRADGADAYWIETKWESNFSGHNTWRLRGVNTAATPPDTQAGINTVGVDYADLANNANNVAWSGITSKPTASTSTSGVLTSTDWNTFNNKLSNTNVNGTVNTIPMFTGTNSIGNSFLVQDTAWGVLNIKQTPQNSQLGIALYNLANDHVWQNTFRTTDNKMNWAYFNGTNWIGERMTLDNSGNLTTAGYVQAVGTNQANIQGTDGSSGAGWNSMELNRYHDANAVNRRMTYSYRFGDKGYMMRVEASIAYANDQTWKLLIGGGTRQSDGWTSETQLLAINSANATFSVPLIGTAASFSTTAAGGQGGLVQIKAPSLAANNNVSLMVGKSLASQQSGFLAWCQGATDASSYLSLQTYSGASPLEIKSTNFNLSKEGNGTFVGTISEGGTLLSNKYGRMAANNTWTGINTFGNTVDFGTQAVKFGDGSNNIKWGLNGLISVASQSSGNNAFRAGSGYWSFSPDTLQYSRTYATTTMLIAGGLEVTGKTYLTNYLRLSNGPIIAPISMAEQTYNLAQPSEAGQMVIINNTNGGPITTVTLTSTKSSFMGRTEGGALFFAATTLTHRCVPIMLLATTATNWEVMNTFGCVSAV